MLSAVSLTELRNKTISYSEILKRTQLNRKTYSDLLRLTKTFDTYPAIAWPVMYAKGNESNINLFKTVKSKSRRQPATTSSILGADVSRAIIQMGAVAQKYAATH